MKHVKKILILCDAHDFIRHESANRLLLKQLYVSVFLIERHFGDAPFNLTINNRSDFDLGVFFDEDSFLCRYLDKYISRRPWKDLNICDYDFIICHPEYQSDIQAFVMSDVERKDTIAIHCFMDLNFQFQFIYSSASLLFSKGGIMEFSGTESMTEDLLEFKKDFDESIKNFSEKEFEAISSNVQRSIKNNRLNFNLGNAKNILVLDDFKRPFFIGDSIYWLAKIKKLIYLFGEKADVYINIADQVTFEKVFKIFQNSMYDNVKITGNNWTEINYTLFDTIICNNDALMKFCWFIGEHPYLESNRHNLYSFSVKDEVPVSVYPTLDFYSNLYQLGYHSELQRINELFEEQNLTELLITKTEFEWGQKWINEKGICKNDRIVILVHGASASEKIMNDVELIKLSIFFSGLDEDIKVLLFTHQMKKENDWLYEIITTHLNSNIILADSYSLREVMSLMGQRQVIAIVGPCTGQMHLANSVYTFLLNHNYIGMEDCPLILTYAGKQSPDRNYHPSYWWQNSKVVSCCVAVVGSEGERTILSHDECPKDVEAFNKECASAWEIEADSLIRYIYDRFPKFVVKNRFKHYKHYFKYQSKLISNEKTIPTFLINLKRRKDRRKSILNQFQGKSLFDCHIINAVEDKNGRRGLWFTIQKIISDAIEAELDFVLICEDDHEFTNNYSDESLRSNINDAHLLNTDVLLGGICSFESIKRINRHLISVEKFACTQFIIIFKPFFRKIMEAEFHNEDCADFKIAQLAKRKLAIFPFVSIQTDFGYSDVSNGYYQNKMKDFFSETSRLIGISLTKQN